MVNLYYCLPHTLLVSYSESRGLYKDALETMCRGVSGIGAELGLASSGSKHQGGHASSCGTGIKMNDGFQLGQDIILFPLWSRTYLRQDMPVVGWPWLATRG